ncbi:MAG TPA: hypothetical protein VHL80_10320, partial [Polyangia bacterium]|nr:hypothetical protein [Polyangia bacterium]
EAPGRAAPPAPPAAPKPDEQPAASAPDASAPAEEPPRRTAADPFGDVGFKEVNQKDWLAALRAKIAQQEKVPPTDLRVSPGLLRAAYVRSPPVAPGKPRRRPPPRRHEIVVVDNQGRRVAMFRAVAPKHGDEPPKDLRFLSEERLVYEVVEPPPEPPSPGKPAAHKAPPKPAHPKKAAPKAAKAGKTAAPKVAVAPPRPLPPLPPARTFVIQPIAARARPIKCVGVHFTFSREKDKLAFVSGTAEAGFVAVDGAQVYPRRGRTVVASAPAWSKDGRSLAFLEARAAQPARLVLLAELDNPTGDTTWDLPPTANTDGALVFWAGSDKLIVGRTQLRPVFSASFTKQSPGR